MSEKRKHDIVSNNRKFMEAYEHFDRGVSLRWDVSLSAAFEMSCCASYMSRTPSFSGANTNGEYWIGYMRGAYVYHNNALADGLAELIDTATGDRVTISVESRFK